MRTRAPTTLEIDEMAPVTLKRRRTETFDMALTKHCNVLQCGSDGKEKVSGCEVSN